MKCYECKKPVIGIPKEELKEAAFVVCGECLLEKFPIENFNYDYDLKETAISNYMQATLEKIKNEKSYI